MLINLSFIMNISFMPRNKSYLTLFCCLKDFNKTTELANRIENN